MPCRCAASYRLGRSTRDGGSRAPPGLAARSRLASARSRTNVEKVVRGKHGEIRLALVALIAEGHLLIEDVPGVGKTMLAKALARSIDCSFRRIQFTPDLLPTDVTGRQRLQPGAAATSSSSPAPIFANIVLGDEINRASPKTQSALLECMEERQVTVDTVTHPLGTPFMVIATQNPIEHEGTYPLPEAQLDRFMLRLVDRLPVRRDRGRDPGEPRVAARRSTTSGRSPTRPACAEMIEQAREVHVGARDPPVHRRRSSRPPGATPTSTWARAREPSIMILRAARAHGRRGGTRLRDPRRRQGARRPRPCPPDHRDRRRGHERTNSPRWSCARSSRGGGPGRGGPLMHRPLVPRAIVPSSWRASRSGSPRASSAPPAWRSWAIGLAVAPLPGGAFAPVGPNPRSTCTAGSVRRPRASGHPGHRAARGREPFRGRPRRSCWWRTGNHRRWGARHAWWSRAIHRGASQRVSYTAAPPDPGPLPPRPAQRRHHGPVRADPSAARVR